MFKIFEKHSILRDRWHIYLPKYFSENNAISLSRHVQVNILVHDVINLLYYEYRTDKQKYFYFSEKFMKTKKLHL